MLDAKTCTQRYNTTRKVLWDEGINEDVKRQNYRHRRHGRTLKSKTYQGYRQETKIEGLVHRKEQEMTFVRKIALLTEKLLPLRYFQWRGSKDLRSWNISFSELLPELPIPAGVRQRHKPVAIKGQAGQGTLMQVLGFVSLLFSLNSNAGRKGGRDSYRTC